MRQTEDPPDTVHVVDVFDHQWEVSNPFNAARADGCKSFRAVMTPVACLWSHRGPRAARRSLTLSEPLPRGS